MLPGAPTDDATLEDGEFVDGVAFTQRATLTLAARTSRYSQSLLFRARPLSGLRRLLEVSTLHRSANVSTVRTPLRPVSARELAFAAVDTASIRVANHTGVCLPFPYEHSYQLRH